MKILCIGNSYSYYWTDELCGMLNAAGYKGDLTFELTSRNKPERKTHDIYNGLDFTGFSALALEKARKFERK